MNEPNLEDAPASVGAGGGEARAPGDVGSHGYPFRERVDALADTNGGRSDGVPCLPRRGRKGRSRRVACDLFCGHAMPKAGKVSQDSPRSG